MNYENTTVLLNMRSHVVEALLCYIDESFDDVYELYETEESNKETIKEKYGDSVETLRKDIKKMIFGKH